MTNTLGHAAGPPRRIPAAAAPRAAAVRASGGRGDASRSEAGARPEFSRFSHPHLCSRFLHPLPSPTLCFSPPRISLSPPHPPAHSPDSPDGTRTAPAAPFPRVPSFLHVSAEGKMLNSGRTGTWSPSRFHSAPAAAPLDGRSPSPLTAGVRSLCGHRLDFWSAELRSCQPLPGWSPLEKSWERVGNGFLAGCGVAQHFWTDTQQPRSRSREQDSDCFFWSEQRQTQRGGSSTRHGGFPVPQPPSSAPRRHFRRASRKRSGVRSPPLHGPTTSSGRAGTGGAVPGPRARLSGPRHSARPLGHGGPCFS